MLLGDDVVFRAPGVVGAVDAWRVVVLGTWLDRENDRFGSFGGVVEMDTGDDVVFAEGEGEDKDEGERVAGSEDPSDGGLESLLICDVGSSPLPF